MRNDHLAGVTWAAPASATTTALGPELTENDLGHERFTGRAGDRIAQLLLVPFLAPEVAVVADLPPSPDERGENGFGSSGR